MEQAVQKAVEAVAHSGCGTAWLRVWNSIPTPAFLIERMEMHHICIQGLGTSLSQLNVNLKFIP